MKNPEELDDVSKSLLESKTAKGKGKRGRPSAGEKKDQSQSKAAIVTDHQISQPSDKKAPSAKSPAPAAKRGRKPASSK